MIPTPFPVSENNMYNVADAHLLEEKTTTASTFCTPRRTRNFNNTTTNNNSSSSSSSSNSINSNVKMILEAQYTPVNSELGEWWDEHAVYSKFSRQGIDIVCVAFEQKNKNMIIANVIIVTGWDDTFLKYAEIVKALYDAGFNVQSYDHQSHGLSGRWLTEPQLLWVNSFDDYVDDFVYFTSLVSKEYPTIPLYVIGYCMGGLIASIAMSRLPTLINRAVLIAPMFRTKCAIKFFNYRVYLPQPIARWIAIWCQQLGLGTLTALGYFKERSSDTLPVGITTSDEEQLLIWKSLRQRYPEIISSCVTNDWVYQAIHAQRKFSKRYEFVRTNTLILNAEYDKFVYDRAMKLFIKKTSSSRLFTVKGGYHDLLHENNIIRQSVTKMILNFLLQNSDNVFLVENEPPLIVPCERNSRLYSVKETIGRMIGLSIAGIGLIIGISLVISKGRRS